MPDLLKPRDVIKDRWVIKEKIGAGGYGQIYRAHHRLGLLEDVAVKVEAADSGSARLALRTEAHVLKKLKDLKHFCDFYEYGETPMFSYIVMSTCYKSLSDLRRTTVEGVFSVHTTFRISLQILKAIADIHSIGFLHRDIKPSNFMTGKGKKVRNLFMLDFGLARKYVTASGNVRDARSYAGFRGTVRYASISTHMHQDMGRKDDLWSMFFMMAEFLEGQLPWSRYKSKDDVLKKKREYNVEKLTGSMSKEVKLCFKEISDHLNSLGYSSKPNNILLRASMVKLLSSIKCEPHQKYDWETGSCLQSGSVCRRLTANSSTKKSASQMHLTDKYVYRDGEIWREDEIGESATGIAAQTSKNDTEKGDPNISKDPPNLLGSPAEFPKTSSDS